MHYARLFQLTLLALLFCGCGSSALKDAKTTVVVAGQAWMEIDTKFAPAYQRARIEARENSSTWEERDAKLEKWEKAREALVTTGYALKTAAFSLAIAEEGHVSDWPRRTACAVEALKAASLTLAALGIDTSGLSKVLDLGKQLVGTCEDLDGDDDHKVQGP